MLMVVLALLFRRGDLLGRAPRGLPTAFRLPTAKPAPSVPRGEVLGEVRGEKRRTAVDVVVGDAAPPPLRRRACCSVPWASPTRSGDNTAAVSIDDGLTVVFVAPSWAHVRR